MGAPCYVTCQNVVKCSLHVGGVQGGGLDKTEVVFLSEGLALVCGYSPQVPQVRLVTNLQDKNYNKSRVNFMNISLMYLY